MFIVTLGEIGKGERPQKGRPTADMKCFELARPSSNLLWYSQQETVAGLPSSFLEVKHGKTKFMGNQPETLGGTPIGQLVVFLGRLTR